MYKENEKSENPKRECWERIAAVIKMAQMTTNGFARHIGLARGENLYQIKPGTTASRSTWPTGSSPSFPK